jgi:hypothetical protein
MSHRELVCKREVLEDVQKKGIITIGLEDSRSTTMGSSASGPTKEHTSKGRSCVARSDRLGT